MNDEDKFKLTILIIAFLAFLAYLHSRQQSTASQLSALHTRINSLSAHYQQPIEQRNVAHMSPRERKANHLSVDRTMHDVFDMR